MSRYLDHSLSDPTLSRTVMSANAFVDRADLEAHIKDLITCVKTNQEVVVTDLRPSWGEETIDSINRSNDGESTRQSRVLRIVMMPTELNACHQDWLFVSMANLRNSGDLTDSEFRQLRLRVGTTLEFRSGPYRGSRKEPDFFLRIDHEILPPLAIESGDGEINTVIIINWDCNRSTRHVSGFVDLYVRDQNGMPVRRQREVVFPAPAPTPIPQRLELTRQEVFGRHLVPDTTRTGSPSAMVYLELDILRQEASEALRHMNLLPA
ncbi:hypothetical protein ASPZODRAFT_23998 [Penicilliopsis zonata CBS 506.65]|uniref:Uncharacterized protein n=1 Tax=Penicilliopsis zonata CBS 506.65 TaxID=1073090 RepID=A0A1L9SMU3_9EURO|nr:hypothetical protein ASPZODRAFT_23998 [Penicilliopsis zonata CBS 506.65]OJJ48357.1 hypothetical protein ASPZODRAFT_23998 [Penicilliopsis zonata CBS 506.65]